MFLCLVVGSSLFVNPYYYQTFYFVYIFCLTLCVRKSIGLKYRKGAAVSAGGQQLADSVQVLGGEAAGALQGLVFAASPPSPGGTTTCSRPLIYPLCALYASLLC